MTGVSDGRQDECEVIAEAGINHNGELEIAKEMVDVAASAGVDTIKFQTFDPDEIVTEETEKASYQERSNAENQHEMLRGKVLSRAEHEELVRYCSSKDVNFLSTPYDAASVSLLDDIGVERYKIASADIVNKPLLRSVIETGKPLILSTGMASLGEIERAVTFLRENGCEDLMLLHCISEYPTDPADANLQFMQTLAGAFDVPVGFSDHTLGTDVPVMAATLGATVIEKHFTLDRSMDGPDHAASLEPDELEQMVEGIAMVPSALGDGTVTRPPEERDNAASMRRSLHARTDLDAGETLCESDLCVVRPFDGIDPWEIDAVVGRTLQTSLSTHEPLTWEHLE